MTRNVEEIFGGVVVAPHQIPYTYNSINGGETFLSLPFYPTTGFVTINGGVQVPIDNFELDGNTLYLGRELDPGDVVFCLFGKIMSPQDTDTGVKIYKFISVGGETSFQPDFTTYGVQSIHVNGIYKTPDVDYTYNHQTGVVNLTTPLQPEQWVVAEMTVKQNNAIIDIQNQINVLSNKSDYSSLNSRETWRRELADLGLVLVAGSFEEGGSLNSSTDAIWSIKLGQCYTWGGTFPKTVPADSSPTSSGGISPTAWISIQTKSLLATMLSPNGGDNLYVGKAAVSLLVVESIFKYLTPGDLQTLRTSLGTVVNVDYALQQAIDAGVKSLYYPAVLGVYEHSDIVTLPIGFTIVGMCHKPYTVSSNASFNNCGTVIRKASGATGIFKLSGRNTFENIIFDGLDKLTGSMNASSQVSGCRFERCGFYRWSRGIGRSSGYVATVYVRGCNISGNNNGCYNLIDSSFVDSVINANDAIGINLQTGANNNSFVRVRVEWNGQEGLLAFNSRGNIFEGELIDRNGYAGVACVSGGQWIINSAQVQRNGKNAGVGSVNNCHFRIEGTNSSLIVDGIRTTPGADDDGGGTVTPEYGLITTGSDTNMSVIIGDSQFTGHTIAAVRTIVTADVRKYRNNTGLSDVSTEGLTQIANGVACVGSPVYNQNLPVHGTLSFSLTPISAALGTYSRPLTRTIEFQCRNNTLSSDETYFLKIRIGRPTTGNVTITPITFGTGGATTWGMSSASPTGVSIDLSISSDGLLITGTLTGIDNSERFVDIYLRP